LDWLSRPVSKIEDVYAGKPFAMMGVSAGGFGTTNAQTNLLTVLRFLKVDLWYGAPPFLVAGAYKSFTADGELADENKGIKLKSFLDGFSEYVR
jgi:NAD(P)H-dependent FMN reductase